MNRDFENQIDDRYVKNIKYPSSQTFSVNFIITEAAGIYDLLLKIEDRYYKLGEGSEIRMNEKKARIEKFLKDSAHWPIINTLEDIILIAANL